MPRKLTNQIKKTYQFIPKYNRESIIETDKARLITKAIDIHIKNKLKEMHQMFDNLQKLGLNELEECFTLPDKK